MGGARGGGEGILTAMGRIYVGVCYTRGARSRRWCGWRGRRGRWKWGGMNWSGGIWMDHFNVRWGVYGIVHVVAEAGSVHPCQLLRREHAANIWPSLCWPKMLG